MTVANASTPIVASGDAGRGSRLRADVIAGLTTALVLVPQAMGYAMLAGLPPISGLHAATLALVVYALFGSSPAMAVGPVAMDSLLTAAALSSLTFVGPEDRLAAAGLLAVMVGASQLAMGTLRLGHLTNFLSAPVISGFTTAAAFLILLTQIPALVGIASTPASGAAALTVHLASHLAQLDPRALAVGLGSIGALVLMDRKVPNVPRAPVVLAAATVLVSFVPGLSDLSRVGAVPRALPGPHLHHVDIETLRLLAPHALAISFVAYLEAYSIAKRFAATCGEPSPSREFFALGASNLASALSGGFPITGGLSRSAVHVRAGARTKFAGVVTAFAVLVATFLLAPVLALIPKSALAAVVATSVASLVDRDAMRRVFRVKPMDGVWMTLAFVATLTFGFQWGIIVGVAASVAAFLFESTRPHVAVLGRLPGTQSYRNVLRYPEAESVAGMLMVRIDAQLYFGNATFLRDTMAQLEADARRKGSLRAVILDASGVNQLDSSAEAALSTLTESYRARGIGFALASVKGPVRDVMKRSGLWNRLGRDHLFLDVHSAVEAFTEHSTPRGT